MASSPTPEEIKLIELAARHAIAEEGGGAERHLRQRTSGKLSARERIDILFDAGTFEDTGRFVTHRVTDPDMASPRSPGDGVITGFGRIHGRVVCAFAQDFTIFGGTLSEANAARIVRLIESAMRIGAPVVGLHDSGGARIQEGIAAIAGYGDIFLCSTLASGVIPQISAILGPCAGAAAYMPALTDFTFTARSTGSLSADEIATTAHLIADDERQCLASIRELLTFLPSGNQDAPPRKPASDDPFRLDGSLNTFIPADINQSYDMLELIRRIVDQDATGTGYLFQMHEHFAPNIFTGFARMDGRSVAIIANQPAVLDGALDSNACIKAARFIRSCDAFNIPLITFEDVAGFASGPGQEHGYSIRHGAQLLHAYAEATVPKLTVVLRKAYGAAYCAMGSKHLGADFNFAWPTAEVLVAKPEAAVKILYTRELESIVRRTQAIMPQGVALSEEQKMEILSEACNEKVDEFRERFASPYVAAERGYIDAVILPGETRRRLNSALDILATKRNRNPEKKHGNIPL